MSPFFATGWSNLHAATGEMPQSSAPTLPMSHEASRLHHTSETMTWRVPLRQSFASNMEEKTMDKTMNRIVYSIYIICVCVCVCVYTVFKVDGPALFQSARIDGADFLNFDTPRGRDIHPPYFCGPRHLCQNVLPMCFRVAPSMQGFLSPKFPSLRNIHPVGCARFFLFPFSFSFPFPLSFSPVPFPFSFPFLRSLSSSLFSFFPFSFLLTLSPSPFFLRDKYAIGWHCPRWLRHLFSSLVVKKSFPRKTFVEHTSPLLFQRFDDRNVRSRKKEFKLKMW